MFISTKHKCIFIHIPKTGGSSVHNTLIEKIKPEIGVTHAEEGHYKLITARKRLKSHMLVPYVDDYFTFCFVRNPWDRFVSAYNYLLTGGSINEDPVTGMDKKDRDNFISPYKTFNDFVLMNSAGNKIYTKLLWQQHFVPQYKFILNAENNLESVDYIGRFENLHEDFDFICKKIGIEPLDLKHLNNRPHESYQLYYTDKTAEIIYNTYKQDIDYFNYSF